MQVQLLKSSNLDLEGMFKGVINPPSRDLYIN